MLKHFLKNNSYKIKRNSYYFVIISCWAIMIYFMHGCSLFGFKARMFAVGCSMGPLLHYWYIWLDRVYAGKALKTLVKKVVVDQLVASPTLGVWYFLGEKDFTGTKSCFSHVVQGVSTWTVCQWRAHLRDHVQRQRLRIKMWVRKTPAYKTYMGFKGYLFRVGSNLAVHVYKSAYLRVVLIKCGVDACLTENCLSQVWISWRGAVYPKDGQSLEASSGNFTR